MIPMMHQGFHPGLARRSRLALMDDQTMPVSNGRTAVYPLSSVDAMFQPLAVVAGWVVEGIVDVGAIKTGLDSLISKWPMLAAKAERTTENNWTLRIPLESLPEGDPGYTLTTRVSSVPLSHYLRLGSGSDYIAPDLPLELLANPDSAQLRDLSTFQQADASMTHWHITHFPQKGQEHTCIGLLFNHGVFDGVGASVLSKGLAAQISGKEWQFPPVLTPGLNANRFQELLEAAARDPSNRADAEKYQNVSIGPVDIPFKPSSLAPSPDRLKGYLVNISPTTCQYLVDNVRKSLVAEGMDDVRVSTGTILSTWFLQTIFRDGSPPNFKLNLTNLGNLRPYFDDDPEMTLYPHNCATPLPHPLLEIKEITNVPLHHLTRRMALEAATFSKAAAVATHERKLEADKRGSGYRLLPCSSGADEIFLVSNLLMASLADLDLSAAGGGRVVSQHVRRLRGEPLNGNNMTITTRLNNGSLLLNCRLSDMRFGLLWEELSKLSSAATKAQYKL